MGVVGRKCGGGTASLTFFQERDGIFTFPILWYSFNAKCPPLLGPYFYFKITPGSVGWGYKRVVPRVFKNASACNEKDSQNTRHCVLYSKVAE